MTIVFFIQLKKPMRKNTFSGNHFLENKNLFDNFLNYHTKLIRDLNNKIKNTSSPVYLLGLMYSHNI